MTWDSPYIPLCCPSVLCCVIAGPRQGFMHLEGTKLMTKGPVAEADSSYISGVLWQGPQDDVIVCSEE